MFARTVRFGADAQAREMKGVDALANAVVVPLGHKGRNVGVPTVIKDGANETTMTRRGANRGVPSAFGRGIMVQFALALMVLANQVQVCAAQDCAGDCDTTGQVTAADLVQMIDIAIGNTDASACNPGDANEDGQITGDEIVRAIHSVFGGCAEQPTSYDALDGEFYGLAFPTKHVTLTQAAAIVAALEESSSTDEEDLRALLSQLLHDSGVQADRIGQIVIYAQREQACDECLTECVPRPPKVCLQNPQADCFCLAPIEPDPVIERGGELVGRDRDVLDHAHHVGKL